ncbi:hypothetical protein EYF80_030866 [Liparis tanakae]|uniref:Uncharacterized protein n=1 Tax=Liparis tanakae TaxID=230148 RepID=A0A4Z2H1J3_9TELE|nr:hypothetical protein EYF80_030866 [Liparis tanakae]
MLPSVAPPRECITLAAPLAAREERTTIHAHEAVTISPGKKVKPAHIVFVDVISGSREDHEDHEDRFRLAEDISTAAMMRFLGERTILVNSGSRSPP